MNRRSFVIDITVNSHRIRSVVIDPHYEIKHSDSINDSIIIELVYLLDGGDFLPEVKTEDFEYYTTDGLVLRGKKYRLVWLLDKDRLYIGVVNAYRRKS